MWKLRIYVMSLKMNYKYAASLFRSLGRKNNSTENCNGESVKDDNVLVKEGLQTLPEGTVLVVDGELSHDHCTFW